MGANPPQSGPVDFNPWSGTWPNVTLEQALVTITGASQAIHVTAVTPCASVSAPSNDTFTITQGNNGECVFIVQDAAHPPLPIIAFDGLPGMPILEISGAQSESDGSYGVTLSSGPQSITAYLGLAPSGYRGGPYTAQVYGSCASATPASATSVPATFTFAELSAGRCFAVIGNSATQSLLVRIDAQ